MNNKHVKMQVLHPHLHILLSHFSNFNFVSFFELSILFRLEACRKLFKSASKSSVSSTVGDDVSSARSRTGARSMPSFSPSSQIGEQFATWLPGSGGSYKKDRPAQQIVNRCLKFLKFCCEQEEELIFEVL